MKVFRTYLLIFVFATILPYHKCIPLMANIPHHIHYMTDLDGLPNYTVYKIFKDSQGMMWFGTFNGICRFDGRSFTHFHIDCPKPFNAVTDIVETEKGEILFGTRKGLYLVNQPLQTCEHICPQINYVNGFGKVGHTLLIGARNGLWQYENPEKAETIKIGNNIISKGNSINDITDDGKGGAWLCSNERLIHLNLRQKTLKTFEADPKLFTGYLRNICRVGERLFIGTNNNGLFAFDPATASFRPYINMDCPVIYDLYSDGKSQLYVSTDGNGAYIIDTHTNQIVRTFRTDTPDYPLPANAVYTFWHDAELGINWFGFAQDGACYNYYRQPVFQIYRYKNFDTGKLTVRSFCIHDGDKAIGTREGLWFISESRDIVHYFTPEQLGGRIVTNIQYFGGHFVIATYEKGLCTLNPKTLELHHLDQDEKLRSGNFSRIEPLQNRLLFACSNMGIFVLDTDFNIVKHFHSRNSELPDGYICDIQFDLTGKGWIGCIDKLAIYDPLTQTIQARDFPKNYFNNEANLTFNLCRNGDILAMSETSVFRTKSDLSEYTTLDLYDRIQVGNIFFVTENRQGKYWIGTDRGLFLFEKDLKHYRQFNETDNLPSLKFNRNEFQETPDGTFWFGCTEGLIYIPRKDQTLLTRPTRGKVILNEATVDGLPLSPSDFHLQSTQYKIRLDWNFRSQTLAIVPLLLNYGHPQGRYYEYSIDGSDFRSYAEGENILFNRLSLGNHDLKIRLAGHEETATTWQISVRPSILFYLETLLFILLLLATWQFHVLKTKRMRIKQAFSRKHQMDMAIAASRAIRMQKERDEQKKKEYEEARAQALYQKSKMNHNEHKTIYKKIKECMEQERPYTNPNLRLTELASMADTTPAKLSQMLNQHLKQTFFDFINLYRVEEFKRRVTDEKNSQYTVSAIAEACGFKRSTFFATFKKFEHCTPTEWLQKKEAERPSKNKAKASKDKQTGMD